MKENVLMDKVVAFGIRIVKAEQHMRLQKGERVLSNQILRSGTSIGANCTEAQNAQSDLDFVHKLNIALKEADETAYWLKLLLAGDYISQVGYDSLLSDLQEIQALLTSIIRTKKQKIKS